MQIPEPIRGELSPGEQVLWSGQPRQGVVVRGADALMIPFSLLWAGFAVFWLISAIRANAPPFFVLFGVPFVLIGIYIVVGRFFVEAHQRANTYYALTQNRIIIVSGLVSRKLKSLNLRTISDLSLSQRSDGTGTITFGSQHPFASMFCGISSWPGAEQYLGPRFDLIVNSREVYELVRKAQGSAQ